MSINKLCVHFNEWKPASSPSSSLSSLSSSAAAAAAARVTLQCKSVYGYVCINSMISLHNCVNGHFQSLPKLFCGLPQVTKTIPHNNRYSILQGRFFLVSSQQENYIIFNDIHVKTYIHMLHRYIHCE